MTYELDLKNSWIDYVTQTAKKYFKIAIDYALENNYSSVRVNRTFFTFDFENSKVWISTSKNKRGIMYKMKEATR